MVRLALAAAAVILAALAGFIGYRTAAFTASPPPPAVAIPNLASASVDANAAAQRLSAAVRFRTTSLAGGPTDDRSQFEQMQQWLVTTYPAFHAASTHETVGDLSLLYTWAGSDPSQPPLLVMAHQDTVPAPPDTRAAWRRDPFGGEIVDGAVWGRGSIDDKGSMIAIFEAAEMLAREGKQPKRTILFAFGHDEEIGGTGAQAIAQLLQNRGVHAWFAIDEGLAIIARHPLTGRPAALIGISEKGSGTLRVTARGMPGHSSIPPPQTAVSSLALAVTRIHTMPIDRRLEGGPALEMMRALAPQLSTVNRVALANEWLSGAMMRRQLANNAPAQALMGTTIAPTVISGGSRPNVLPGEATALINLRIHPRDTAADLLARARRAVAGIEGVSVDWDTEPREASPVSRVDSSSYALIAALSHAIYPEAPVAPGLVLAGTDSRSYVAVADNIYRFQPIVLTDDELETIHGVNEHLTLENLDRMIRFYLGLMQAGAMQ